MITYNGTVLFGYNLYRRKIFTTIQYVIQSISGEVREEMWI